jgi:hypothetical protein
MARWPSATWDPASGDLGNYSSGPYKIVHHTTEGTTYSGARQEYATVYQHIDTARVARALRNEPGGIETNRASAVQIELIGFAGRPKDPRTLANVAGLCPWIEQTHGVPQTWPNGHPREPLNGQNPGGHNRDGTNWTTRSGHYGHSQVPENTHWDPAYTRAEVAVVTPGG